MKVVGASRMALGHLHCGKLFHLLRNPSIMQWLPISATSFRKRPERLMRRMSLLRALILQDENADLLDNIFVPRIVVNYKDVLRGTPRKI